MADSSDYRLGSIWIVSFDPSIGTEIRKTRPALIVSGSIFNVKRSKFKFWFKHQELGVWLLYKQIRENTGEDWSVNRHFIIMLMTKMDLKILIYLRKFISNTAVPAVLRYSMF